MNNRQIRRNIKDLDLMIGKLNEELLTIVDTEEFDTNREKVRTLIDARCLLADSLSKGSIKPLIISGTFGLASILTVLHYEKEEVITSKAMSIATKMFKGSI